MGTKPLVGVDAFRSERPETEHERLTRIVNLAQFKADFAVSGDRQRKVELRRRAVERSRHRVPYE